MRLDRAILVLCTAAGFWFIGHSWGKHSADRWYHAHPEIKLAHLPPCTVYDDPNVGFGDCVHAQEQTELPHGWCEALPGEGRGMAWHHGYVDANDLMNCYRIGEANGFEDGVRIGKQKADSELWTCRVKDLGSVVCRVPKDRSSPTEKP